MAAVAGHRRAVSEPALPLYCSSYARRRCRASTLEYEQGKDKLAFWVGSWDSDKICALLQSLVARCSLQQLGYLWTALESVPHRDFLTSLEGDQADHASRPYTPLSTPVTRQVTAKLARSKMPQNKRLYRAQSTVINNEVVSPDLFACQSEVLVIESRPTSPEATNPSKLPGLRQSTAPSHLTPSHRPHSTPPVRVPQRLPPTRGHKLTLRSRTPISRSLTAPPSRVQSPVRRHMLSPPPPLDQSLQRRAHTNTPHTFTKRAFMAASPATTQHSQLSSEALQFLAWFVQLPQAWQQQELLQLMVTNLDHKELYYLATLLMSRQYRDFVANLPEALVVMVMAFVPAKDILRNCCLVSHGWNSRCSTDGVWKRKVEQRRIGLPLSNFLSWKSLYLDDLRLKRNWTRGHCAVKEISSSKVLSVAVRDGMLVTGGADRTVRVWKLSTGECLTTLYGHMRGVWSVCFYGKNFVISGSGDHTIRLWNYRAGLCERTLTGHAGTVWALKQKRELLISGSHDKTAILWDIRHCARQTRLEGHHGGVFGVDLDQETVTAYTASGDKTIRQWEVSSGVCMRMARPSREHPVMALHWDQGYLAASAGDVITLWDGDSLKRVREFKGHEERVESVQLTVYSTGPVHGVMLSASQDRTVKYWDIKSGRCVRTLRGHEHKLSCAVADEIRVVSADEGSLRMWDFHPHRTGH